MALYNPPPPLLTTATTTTDTNAASASNILYTPPHSNNNNYSSTSTSSSIIIVIIVISSAIIVSASIYLLLRFFSRAVHSFPPQNDAVSNRFTETRQNNHDHVINFGTDNNNNNKLDIDTCSLPLFKFSSLPDTNAGGDCAVCLSKFEPVDQLRLLPMCCHAFHAQCIDAWLKTNLTCPLCRSTVIPTEDDVRNKTLAGTGTTAGGGHGGVGRNNSFRIEIGSLSRRRTPSDSGRRSYSIGSYEYVLDDGYEVPVESAHRSHRREVSDKDSVTPEVQVSNLAAEIGGGGGGGSGRLNWLRDYVDRVSVSISSRSQSFRSSGRFFAGSSRRSEEYDGRVGEEISELFRWLSGV